MYSVLADHVTVQISNALNRIGFAVQLKLVRLHDFLNGLANIAQSNVDTGRLDAGVRRLLDRLQQIVVLLIERQRERTVHNATVHVHTEIDLTDVIVVQHGLIATVRCVVSSAVVQRATGRKSQTGLQTFLSYQFS